MRTIKRYLCKLSLVLKSFRYFKTSVNGKDYLIVLRTGWNGTKWSRWFEIGKEVDKGIHPINGIYK